jgi:hypothetical protein
VTRICTACCRRKTFRKPAINRWDKCRDDAFAPFAAKLPPPPAADKEIVYKNDAYVRIENAGRAAQDRKCGAAATFEAKTLAPMRKKLLALIATARAKALGELVAKLQK